MNAYDEHGMDPVRFRSVLEKGCRCSRQCMRQFTFDDIHNLCRVYHQMASRRSNVWSQVQGLHADVSGRSSAITSVCLLSAIYWGSAARNYTKIRLAIDGRRSVDDAGPIHPRGTPQLYMCHHFFRRWSPPGAKVWCFPRRCLRRSPWRSPRPRRPSKKMPKGTVGFEVPRRQSAASSSGSLDSPRGTVRFEVPGHVEIDSEEDAEGDACLERRCHPSSPSHGHGTMRGPRSFV